METKDVINKNRQKLMQIYSPSPLVFQRGKGMFLYDTAGKEYLDFSAQFSSCSLGHCNEELNKTIAEQLSKVVSVTTMFMTE